MLGSDTVHEQLYVPGDEGPIYRYGHPDTTDSLVIPCALVPQRPKRIHKIISDLLHSWPPWKSNEYY